MDFEQKIEYVFNNKKYLKQALTHSSFSNENDLKYDNERLEYLGDAVLELIVSDYLFQKYPNKSEGDLTKYRASLVCETNLAKIARNIKIGDYLKLGNGEDTTGGRNKDSILSDAVEAVIGAVYLDGGIKQAKKLIFDFFKNNDIKEQENVDEFDNKTRLQEIFQRDSTEPISYVIIDESGPAHNRIFKAQVSHQGKILGEGIGKSKKESEQNAALQAINNHNLY